MRVLIWSHDLAPELVHALAQHNIEVIAVMQAESNLVPAFSMHDCYFGSAHLRRYSKAFSPSQFIERMPPDEFRSYARCIARLGFLPFSKQYYSYFGGSMPLTDLEDCAQLHLQLAMELLNGLNVDQVWFFAALHLGLDNAMAYAAQRLGKTVMVNLQLPVPLKFSYQLYTAQAALNAPPLAFLPWDQGARAPDLFYMLPPEPRSLARSMPERVRFTLKQLLSGDLKLLATRWYLAAGARKQVRLQGWLEFLDPAQRAFSGVRRKQRREWTQGKLDRTRIALNAQQGPFVYFALHYEPEASTSSAGGEFNSQLDALCALSALLPAGWRILVKENPQQGFLHRSAVFYERIKLIPNIAFVNDDCPSQDLLERAQVVATISGTVGFEAMLAGRACLHFGTPWYAGLPGAIAYHARLDLTLIALQRVQKPELDAAINRLLSQSADGIIAPRFAQLLGPDASWASYADITARSLATIAALTARTETTNN